MFAEKFWEDFKVVDVEKNALTIKVTLNPKADHQSQAATSLHRYDCG